MASTAAPSAAFLSPRPIHRAAASAPASVARTNSMAMLRSGGWTWLTGDRSASLLNLDPARGAEQIAAYCRPRAQSAGRTLQFRVWAASEDKRVLDYDATAPGAYCAGSPSRRSHVGPFAGSSEPGGRLREP
jgi:hypothetical protein